MLKKPKKRKKTNTSKWVEFNDIERSIIYERDGYRCIHNGTTAVLGVAHVFVPRSKGGVGNRYNGVLLSQIIHDILDDKSHLRHEQIKLYCENYLIAEYGNIDIQELIYKNWTFKKESE
jgi:hypothetical protein